MKAPPTLSPPTTILQHNPPTVMMTVGPFSKSIEAAETSMTGTAIHLRRGRRGAVMVLLLLVSASFLLTPSRCVSASPSSRSGSWWDGMKFDDNHNATEDVKQQYQLSETGGPMLQVPCGLMMTVVPTSDGNDTEDVLPLSTVVDTGMTTSTVRSSVLQRYPQLQTLIRPGDGQQQKDVFPSGTLLLRMGSVEATVAAPALQIEPSDDTDDWDLRLGLDFLRRYQAKVDVGDEEMQLRLPEDEGEAVVSVPFLRPRPELNLGDDDTGEL